MTELPRWAPPLLAVQFLTRVPVTRRLDDLTQDQVKAGLARAVVWFPVVGGLVGCVTAGVILGALHLWSLPVAIILALIVEARLTGAFHEDAVADFCDGFGGGLTPDRVHEIMKDSRIGTYGALGLMLAVGMRFALILSLPVVWIAPVVIGSAALGRWTAVIGMAMIPPKPEGQGLVKDIGSRPGVGRLAMTTLLLVPFLVPITLLVPWIVPVALVVLSLFLFWFRGLVIRRLGGVTGDCLGFAVYAAQLLFLGVAAAWN